MQKSNQRAQRDLAPPQGGSYRAEYAFGVSTGSWTLAIFLAALCLLLFYADAAFAQNFSADTSFRCSGGHATGQLFNPGPQCPTSLTTTNFFSFLICNIEQLSSDIFGHMYCGLIQSLAPLVWACATLAVIFFGISFMIGLTSLGRGGAILFAIKIAFVTALATNADVLIGVGYRFFITAMSDGIAIVVTSLGTGYHSAADVYSLLDGFLAKAFGMATDLMSAGDNAANEERCKNAVFAVIGTMMIAFPLLGYLAIALIARIAMTFFRAVFGYVYAIIGITFLMILAPFFMCFYLFKQTQSFFQKWLSYLVSFSLQAVLLFTFMIFVLNVNVSSQHLTGGIPNLIMYHKQEPETATARFFWKYCTLCDFEIIDKDGNKIQADDKNLLSEGKLQCTQPKKPIEITHAISPKSTDFSKLSPLILLGAQGILSLIILAWMVERLLFMLPYLAQMLSSKMGANAAPQLGGGWAPFAPAVHAPGSGLAGDFAAGFKQGYGSQNNGVSAAVSGVRDGFAAMVSGRQNAAGETVAMGATNRFISWLSDPSRQ